MSDMGYKLYRRHDCASRHRTWKTAAKCIWRRAAWITGDGRYALLAYCDVLTVTLWDDPTEAEERKAFIDQYQCGHACTGRHEIVELTPAARGA